MYDNEREDEMSRKSDMDTEQLEYLTGALIDIEMENLMQFRRTVDFDMLKTLVNDIQEAPEVVIIGSRASSVLVSYATYIFNKIGIRTSGFDAADTKSLDSIINIDRTALVIAFGFARFPKSTIVTSRFLKNRGYKIVSITADSKSPLVELSEYAFRLKASSYGYTDSYSSAMLLINLIVVLIGKLGGTDTEKRLREFDETAQQLDFYL